MRARFSLLCAAAAAALALPQAGFAQQSADDIVGPPVPESADSIGTLLVSPPVPGAADSLREALLEAYLTNPQLAAARAGQRANDENVPLALAQSRPQLNVTGTLTEAVRTSPNSFTSPTRIGNAQFGLEFPIYQGGAVRHGIDAAENRVEAGRADLRSTEANLFVQVVAAYMDVIANRNIVTLNENQVRVLDTNFEATSDRFEIGDLTRTDVAQAEARLALARSALQNARAEMQASEENYLELVGSWPENLAPPPPLPELPDNPDQAEDVAVVGNPAIVAARFNADAAREDIDVAEAARLPRLSAVASANYNNYFGTLGGSAGGGVGTFRQRETTGNVGLQATIPLYQGGGPSARVRQTNAVYGQAQEQIVATERAVIADVRAAFSRYRASLAVIDSTEVAVSANALALEGVRAENSVGLRQVLDVLNAEQELLNSQVDLITARRNAYVAGFNLLAAMGRAEAPDLGLDGGALYDPMANYDRVRGKWSDFDDDPLPVTQSTRTVDNPQRTIVTIPEN